jgi:hypothetical protein
MSLFTYGISGALALSGTGIAIAGIIAGEFKPFVIGLVLLFGAMVFARLYVGTRRGQVSEARQGGGPLEQR